MKKLKQNKGITLIVLVITIIILLILTGIIISSIAGNGLFLKAKQARIKERYTSAKEKVNIELMTVQIDCEERKKEYSQKADKRLRNTKLLLRNYHMLKEHAERSVFGRVQMKESALDILESMMSLYDNKVIIESIKRSATRTAIIVSHIETMLGLYKIYCEKSVNPKIDQRRYEVIWDMYLANQLLTAEEIANKQHISKESVYSDIKIAIERLAALIFGVDGLNVQ